MEDILKTFIEQNHLPQWFIGIIITIWILIAIVKWVFSENTTWLTPFESRKRGRREEFEKLISSETNTSLKDLLENQRQAMVFERISGITEEDERARDSIINLHKNVPHRFKWRYIREAYPELRFDDNGNLVKGISISSMLSLIPRAFFAIVFLALGVYVGLIYKFPITQDLALKVNLDLIQMSSEAILVLIGLLIIIPSLPSIRALQLSKYIL